jgi:hypothetical protein
MRANDGVAIPAPSDPRNPYQRRIPAKKQQHALPHFAEKRRFPVRVSGTVPAGNDPDVAKCRVVSDVAHLEQPI